MKGEQSEICPKCGGKVFANFVDNGIGLQQIEPYHCTSCKWTEFCPYIDSCPGERCASYSYCSHISKLKKAQNKIAKNLFGVTALTAISKKSCISCGQSAKTFNDKLSFKEYMTSGLCQKCQDDIWQDIK